MKKDVPVRHKDKEALRINKRFAVRRMLAESIQKPSDCALFEFAHFNPGFRFTTPGAIVV